MPYALRYSMDELDPGTAAHLDVGGAHHLVYVARGSARVGDVELEADGAAYAGRGLGVRAGASGALLYRWDLVADGAAATRLDGSGVRSTLRMARDIWSLDLRPGGEFLFRLDRIVSAPGTVIDVHTHPGPGIRVLLAGTYRVRMTSEDGAADAPGDPWWETGLEAVISTPNATIPSTFLRGLVFPTAFAGRHDTATFHRRRPAGPPNWKLYVDQVVTLT